MGQMQSNGKPLRRILGILITTMVVALLGALLVGFLMGRKLDGARLWEG